MTFIDLISTVQDQSQSYSLIAASTHRLRQLKEIMRQKVVKMFVTSNCSMCVLVWRKTDGNVMIELRENGLRRLCRALQ